MPLDRPINALSKPFMRHVNRWAGVITRRPLALAPDILSAKLVTPAPASPAWTIYERQGSSPGTTLPLAPKAPVSPGRNLRLGALTEFYPPADKPEEVNHPAPGKGQTIRDSSDTMVRLGRELSSPAGMKVLEFPPITAFNTGSLGRAGRTDKAPQWKLPLANAPRVPGPPAPPGKTWKQQWAGIEDSPFPGIARTAALFRSIPAAAPDHGGYALSGGLPAQIPPARLEAIPGHAPSPTLHRQDGTAAGVARHADRSPAVSPEPQRRTRPGLAPLARGTVNVPGFQAETRDESSVKEITEGREAQPARKNGTPHGRQDHDKAAPAERDPNLVRRLRQQEQRLAATTRSGNERLQGSPASPAAPGNQFIDETNRSETPQMDLHSRGECHARSTKRARKM